MELSSTPPVRPAPPEITLDSQQERALSQEIDNLLRKGAIHTTSASDGYFSPMFVVPKKGGGWRPVINLRSLNQFIYNPHFKMENISSLKGVLQKGDFMGRLDLKDAYLSVPVAREHWKLLRFRWKGQSFEFQTLPFGLASAPRIFTKLLRPVTAAMRRKGIRLLVYLDDILVMAEGRETLRRHLSEVAETLSKLGFVINTKKSIFEPTQEIEFLGFIVDSKTMHLLLPQEKVDKVKKSCRSMTNKEVVTPRQLAHLIGLLTSTLPAILPAPLHYRALQRVRNTALWRSRNYDCPCQLTPEAKKDLSWWTENLPQWNGQNLSYPTPDMVLTSDASREGWGATYEAVKTGGMWSVEEREFHINFLELKAALLALQVFASQMTKAHILLHIDNKQLSLPFKCSLHK